MTNFLKNLPMICLLEFISAEFQQSLFKLANEITGNYFRFYQCVTVIVDDPNNIDFLDRTFPVYVVSVSGREYPTIEGKLLSDSYEQGCGGFLIQTQPDIRWSLIRKLVDAKNEAVSYRYNTQRYVMLPVDENDTAWEVLTNEDMFYFPNLVLIIPERKSDVLEFHIFGHTTFDGYRKDVLGEDYELIDSWSPRSGFKHHRYLFPDKIKNIYGKKIIFGLMHYIPYSIIIQEDNKTVYDGLETRLAVQFVKYINGTWDGLDHPVEMWGTKFPNNSGTGIYGSVQKHLADFGFSAIYQWYCDVLDCSYPYIQPEVICLVPRPQILSGWLTILLPFSISTWIGFCAAYCISFLFVFWLILAQNHMKTGKTGNSLFVLSKAAFAFYTIFRVQLQQIPRFAHKNHPLATFIKVSMLYYFFIVLSWQGGISSILTVPRYEEPINTVVDLVSRWPKVKWGAIHDVWIHSIENSTDPNLNEIVKKFVILDYDSLVKKTKTRDFGFFIEMLPNGHYGFNEYINEETVPYLRLMEHSIYTGFGVIILPKSSPYTEKLNHLVQWMFATGLVQKLEIQVSLERIDNHLQNMIRLSNEKETGKVILSWRHIEGPVYIYFCGIFFSMLAFAGENIVFWRKLKQKKF